MDFPVVGKDRRKTHPTQAAGRNSEAISHRIQGTRCSGCSSPDHQHAVGPQSSMRNDDAYALGALCKRRTAPEGNLNSRHIHDRGEPLDSSTMGESPTQRSKNARGRTLVAGNRLGGRNQGQNQMCDVGLVFTCGPLGILWTQPNLVGNSCRHGRKPRPEHGRPCQCQTPESSPGSVTGRGQARSRRVTVSGSAPGFLDWALGTRRGEVGALRWMDCDFPKEVFYIQHSYYWRRGGHLKATKTEASAKPLPMHPALKNALLEWKTQSLYAAKTDFVFPSLRLSGRKPLDLAAVLNRKIKPAFGKLGIKGVGWHTFRHSVRSILASMGEHQLTIRDYLRHSNLNVTNQYLQATSTTKRLAQGKLVDAILPTGSLSASKSTLIQ